MPKTEPKAKLGSAVDVELRFFPVELSEILYGFFPLQVVQERPVRNISGVVVSTATAYAVVSFDGRLRDPKW